jgi:hypothetical protein
MSPSFPLYSSKNFTFSVGVTLRFTEATYHYDITDDFVDGIMPRLLPGKEGSEQRSLISLLDP